MVGEAFNLGVLPITLLLNANGFHTKALQFEDSRFVGFTPAPWLWTQNALVFGVFI